MKMLGTKQGNLEIRPNMVNYVEEDERGLHFHFSLNKPWTLYLGDWILYRKEAKMTVIENAWERDFYSLLDLRIHLDTYMASGNTEMLTLEIKGQVVHLLPVEVMFLRKEIESIVRWMKFETNKWELRPVGQRVPEEHLYAMN